MTPERLAEIRAMIDADPTVIADYEPLSNAWFYHPTADVESDEHYTYIMPLLRELLDEIDRLRAEMEATAEQDFMVRGIHLAEGIEDAADAVIPTVSAGSTIAGAVYVNERTGERYHAGEVTNGT